MTARPAPPPTKMSPEDCVKKAIALLQRIKHLSIDVDGEARKHKSQRLVELSHAIDVDATDGINALFGVKF
jgi:hypothetical protein